MELKVKLFRKHSPESVRLNMLHPGIHPAKWSAMRSTCACLLVYTFVRDLGPQDAFCVLHMISGL